MHVCFRTKKLVVDVIRIQPGEALPEILESPASASQVILSCICLYILNSLSVYQIYLLKSFIALNSLEMLFGSKELEHKRIVEWRTVQDAQTPEGLKSSPAVLEDSQLPLEQKKRKILRNLRNLEQAGLVTGSNKYQDIINDISKVCN